MGADKIHYYDGKIYEVLFDRALSEVRKLILEQIEPGCRVIDVGCGTGSLVFELAKKCESVVGVELSSKMVKHANSRLSRLDQFHDKVSFLHKDATKLSDFEDEYFDYLTISMALHEMPAKIRLEVLKEAKRVAKRIIIADYAAPMPVNIFGIITRTVEFFAGIEHFKSFLDYQKRGGIGTLLEKSQFTILSEKINKKKTIKVVVAN